jgi:predicted DNA-binding transcriptional regulator AlpA
MTTAHATTAIPKPRLAVEQPAPLWSVVDVSNYLGVPVETLYAWRKARTGPPVARIGRYLRYDPDAVRAWFTRQAAAQRGEEARGAH